MAGILYINRDVDFSGSGLGIVPKVPSSVVGLAAFGNSSLNDDMRLALWTWDGKESSAQLNGDAYLADIGVATPVAATSVPSIKLGTSSAANTLVVIADIADVGQILSAFGVRIKLSSLKLRTYYSGSEKVSSFSVPATLGCFFIRGDAASINIGYITGAGAIGDSVTYSTGMTADADILLGGSSYSSAVTGLNIFYAAGLYASNLSDSDMISLGLQLIGYCKTTLGVTVS